MADAALLTNFQNFMTELMLSRQITFAMEFPLLAELSGNLAAGGRDPGYQRYTKGLAALKGDRDTFHGKKITIPLQLSDVSAAGIAEGATFPGGVVFDSNQATLNLSRVVAPVALSIDLVRDAKNGSTSALESAGAYVESAYRAAARIENDMLHGNGDGLLCNVNSSTGSGTLVVDVGTAANFDQLTPGRIVSVLTRSNGADPGNGKRRKIASVARSTGLVTFSTTAVASDGGSGNITFSSNEGVYLDNTYGSTMAAQGLQQACATSGSFEGITKGTVAQWNGVNVSASSAALDDPVLDNVVYLLRGNGLGASDFGIAHPKVIDAYKQSKASLVTYTYQEANVKSGFSGIVYQGADKPYPLIKDLSAPRKTLRLIAKDAVQLYGDEPGPGFMDDDGSMWHFFARAAVKEADLYDRWQFGVKDCGKLAEITALLEATP